MHIGMIYTPHLIGYMWEGKRGSWDGISVEHNSYSVVNDNQISLPGICRFWPSIWVTNTKEGYE